MVDKNIIFEGIELKGENKKFALQFEKDNSEPNEIQSLLLIIDKETKKPIPGVKFKITDKDGKIKIKLDKIHATDVAGITSIKKNDAKKLLKYVKENNPNDSPTDKWKEIIKIATEFNEIKDIITDKETKDEMNMDTFLKVKKSMKDQNSNNETPAIFYAKNIIAYSAVVLYKTFKPLDEFKAIMTNEDDNDAIKKEYKEKIKENKGELLVLFNCEKNPKIEEFADLVFNNFFNIENLDFTNKDNIDIINNKGYVFFVEEEIRKEKENKIVKPFAEKWMEKIKLKKEQEKLKQTEVQKLIQ